MTTLKAYHGTCYDIDNFNIYNNMGMNTGNNGGAIFFTTSEQVACSYSRESFIRKNEYNEDYEPIEDIYSDACAQQHFYMADINTDNALTLDIREVFNSEFMKKIMDAISGTAFPVGSEAVVGGGNNINTTAISEESAPDESSFNESLGIVSTAGKANEEEPSSENLDIL